jgi:L-cystine transport system permease protein
VLIATVSGIILGVLLALIQLERIPILRQLCQLFVSFVRGTPIMVQMFIVYYALPMLLGLIGIDITRWEKIFFIYVTYGLSSSAFFSEIIRSAVQSVPKSQTDAAGSIGLTRPQTYLRVILPQSVVIAIPSIGTSIIGLLQSTSLAFSLGILDVVGRIRTLGTITARVLEGYIVAAVIFVVLSIMLEQLFGFIERKMRYGAKGEAVT